MRPLRIGTRGSELALWQAHYVRQNLGADQAEIVIIKTEGDRVQNKALHEMANTGVFTKQLEEALLAESIDLAVHSFKDVPTEMIPELAIAAIPERGPVRDAMVRRQAPVRATVEGSPTPQKWGLAHGARVGTGSLRRRAQVLSRRPDLEMVPLRGNVPTRFKKVLTGELDAVVLAEAGLVRLGLEVPPAGIICEPIAPEDVCPAPSQCALAIQIRARDTETGRRLAALHHPPTATAVGIERQLLARFGGGCHLPLGALASAQGDVFSLQALVAAPAGEERLAAQAEDASPDRLVERVYDDLTKLGAAQYF